MGLIFSMKFAVCMSTRYLTSNIPSLISKQCSDSEMKSCVYLAWYPQYIIDSAFSFTGTWFYTSEALVAWHCTVLEVQFRV